MTQDAVQETARIDALHSLNILDTGSEDSFEELVQLATIICDAPIGLLNFLDKDRQWFKARLGMHQTELPRAGSLCNHLIGETKPLVVADATRDPRFCESPFVVAASGIRFYAGAPLVTETGYTVGTLCVADTVPHTLKPHQVDGLMALSKQAYRLLTLREKVQQLNTALAEKESVERALRARTELFDAFMDHGPTVAFIKDREGRFCYYNRLFCERFAVSPGQWIGKNVLDLFPNEFAAAYHDLDMAVLASGASEVIEETSPGPNGTTLYWRTHKFRIGDNSRTWLLGGLCLDISREQEAVARLQKSHTQLEEANQELTELSTKDGLTGLRNRRAFDLAFARELKADTVISLVLLDIDHFKSLNDTHGHPAGDQVLRTVASLLNQHSREVDFVARYGGEEFIVLLARTNENEALAIAERLRIEVERFPWSQQQVTLSAGVATRSGLRMDGGRLLEAADAALYQAKRLGRNRVVGTSNR